MASLQLIGYDSALAVYRRARMRIKDRPHVEVSLRELTAPKSEFLEGDICRWLRGARPGDAIHVLVPDCSGKRHTQGMVTHVWGWKYDVWPAILLTDLLYVSSPEFLFLQMATILDDTELIFLGYELCGRYGLEGGCVCKRPSLTTTDAIRRFLTQRPGARGAKRALAALKYVVDGSGSPIETELTMRLCLPRRRGGRGLMPPALNSELTLNKKARQVLGISTITPDVLWRCADLALEYDSDSEHTGADRISRDARRRLAYDAMGIQAVTVTNEMLQSPNGFESLVRRVAAATGKRLRAADWDEQCRRRDLWRRVHALATHPEALTWSAHQNT